MLGITGIQTIAGKLPRLTDDSQINVLGPRKGYSPHIGSVVSMLDWMRFVMLRAVEGMGQKELDFLLDENANSIGGMLYHLAATDKWYQLHTFEGIDPQAIYNHPEFASFQAAMELGDKGRAEIRGNDLNYYLDILEETRAQTLEKLAQRDDDWLLETDENFPWGPTNNYCKWFHVCEHESNHNGQIKLIRSRIS